MPPARVVPGGGGIAMSDENGAGRGYDSYPDPGLHAGEQAPDPPFARTLVNRLLLPVICLVVAAVGFIFWSSNTQEVVATSNDGVSYVFTWDGQTYAGALTCRGKAPDANCGSHQFAVWINPSNPGKAPRTGSPSRSGGARGFSWGWRSCLVLGPPGSSCSMPGRAACVDRSQPDPPGVRDSGSARAGR